MGKFDGLLLVSDFDDTLYDSRHQVPQRNQEAIRYFRSEGGKFTVATGRAYRTFAPYRHLVPLDGPVVLSNGSALYDFQADQVLEQTCLSATAPRDLEKLLEAFPSLAIEVYHQEDIFVWNPNSITEAHMRKVGTDYEVRPVAEMPHPWTKAIVQQEYSVLLQAQKWLLERYGHLYEAIFSNQYYLEITEKGSTKGDMVDKLARHNRQGSFRTKDRYYEAVKRFCAYLATYYHLQKLENISGWGRITKSDAVWDWPGRFWRCWCCRNCGKTEAATPWRWSAPRYILFAPSMPPG